MVQHAAKPIVSYDVPRASEDWTLPEEPVPESQPHDVALDLLKLVLLAFVARTKMDALVARNLAVRFVESNPRIGVDPDLCLVTPRPPEGDELESLRLWREGHAPPLVAVEIVSESNAQKDYTTAPERYAASGATELWIFDPKLAGPKRFGGPLRLQVWGRDDRGELRRKYAGTGPAYSEALGAWLVPIDEGMKLRIADDEAGTRFWLTEAEAERAEKERERAEKEALAARVAELEAELRATREGRS